MSTIVNGGGALGKENLGGIRKFTLERGPAQMIGLSAMATALRGQGRARLRTWRPVFCAQDLSLDKKRDGLIVGATTRAVVVGGPSIKWGRCLAPSYAKLPDYLFLPSKPIVLNPVRIQSKFFRTQRERREHRQQTVVTAPRRLRFTVNKRPSRVVVKHHVPTWRVQKTPLSAKWLHDPRWGR